MPKHPRKSDRSNGPAGKRKGDRGNQGTNGRKGSPGLGDRARGARQLGPAAESESSGRVGRAANPERVTPDPPFTGSSYQAGRKGKKGGGGNGSDESSGSNVTPPFKRDGER